jgi:hypothetical protein
VKKNKTPLSASEIMKFSRGCCAGKPKNTILNTNHISAVRTLLKRGLARKIDIPT